jgi:hypothetical protein
MQKPPQQEKKPQNAQTTAKYLMHYSEQTNLPKQNQKDCAGS